MQASWGFIKGQATGKLTGCEDGFARLLLASLQCNYNFLIFLRLCKNFARVPIKSKCPPAPNLNETPGLVENTKDKFYYTLLVTVSKFDEIKLLMKLGT